MPRQRQKKSRWIRKNHGSRSSAARPRFRPQLEQLENRVVLNYNFGGTSFQWVELLSNGLAVPGAFGVTGTADDWSNPVDLGSNTINFYGTTYSGHTALWASSNGMLTFGSPNSDFRPGDLLTNPGQAAIAPLWMDLYDFDPQHLMISAELDTANNRLIIEWDHVYDTVTHNPITFEVIIQMNTGNTPGYIIFNYQQLDDFIKGSHASIGIKDGGFIGPNDVVSLPYPQPQSSLVDDKQAILFSWELPGPNISSLSANSASEGSSDLSLTVNGNNFTNSSLVEANGIALTTSFTSDNQLQATLPAFMLAEEGGLSITVADPSGTSNAAPFNVIDAPLVASGQFLSGTEGQPLTGGLVATFTDADPNGTAADYSATVTWDDGHTSTGTIQLLFGNTFGVYADNNVPYAEEGTYGVSVTINDLGGSQATVTSQVLVSDASLSATGSSISATEGSAFSGQVASFSDADPKGALGDYSAVIDWGDGQTSPGKIAVGPGGSFVVNGSHTYAEEGNFTVSVKIVDAGAPVSASGSAVVADATLNAQITGISATEGAPFSGNVATFTDANANAAASDFTVTIYWGDGGSSSGTVTANGGGLFTVSGSYTYAEEGNFPISVVINDVGTATASASGSANVADAPLSASGVTITPLEGVNFTSVVASFTDADPKGAVGDYQATIDWGDGSTSMGSFQANPNGGFDVVGSHIYKNVGTTSITVTIQDMGGSNNIAKASSTAVTGDAPLTAAGVITSATEGIGFSGTVASFTDADMFADPSKYSVTINWGDSSTSPGQVVANPAGGFLVIGTHTYAEEGSATVQVNVFDHGGSSASVTSTMNIGDAGLSASGLPITATEGTAFTSAVANFSDAGIGTADDFSATINWGDGSTGPGTITDNGGGNYSISGSHTYSQEGNFGITVTIHDVGGAGTSANSTAQVADAPLSASGSPVSSVEGGMFSGVVATFNDANLNALASDFSAVITWGDGNTSPGSITALGNGQFSISGTNSYADEGSFSIGVQINDVGASTTASTTANVADAPLQASGTFIHATEGQLFVGTVATFTDGNVGSTASDFTATITWGDGKTSPGAIIPLGGGKYDVRASHTYSEEGIYVTGVQINDVGGSMASATSRTLVTDADIFGYAGQSSLGGAPSFNGISAMEGGSFSGVVANFTDGNPSASMSDFSATISWGDGTTSKGTISANNFGGYDVTGSHTYAIEGGLAFSVTITDVGGSTATANGMAAVADAPLSANGLSLTETQGVAFNAVLASFTDANLQSTASDFKAVITWGDGTISNGTVSQNSAGNFSVLGSYKYALAGDYSISIQIFDAGGASATASDSVHVVPVGISATGTTVNATEGQSFTAVVANFLDANPSLGPSDFSATITWGDGTTSAGTIAPNGSGGFSVTGTYTYGTEGSEAISVVIRDNAGGMAQANSTVLIADSVPVVHATAHHQKHHRHVVVTGSFSDSAVEDHTVLVNWGDGTFSTLDLGVSKSGSFVLEHDYTGSFLANHHGVVHITVTVLDDAGTAASQTLNVNFNEGHHHVKEHHHGQHQENHGDLWDIPGMDFFS
jgi:hypothetical protein